MMYLSKEAEYIINTLNNNGFEAYAVGGCVRDMLLGLAPADWDICTSASPKETEICFDNHTVLETGLAHGTVTLILNHKPYEITTFRCDGDYSDNRHPNNVQFVKNIEEDLKRRDFTINAMAYNGKKLIDLFGGREDLYSGIIRTVGNAEKRFQEDGLRILRGLRFGARLNFKIDYSTALAMLNNKHLLDNIAKERIYKELKQFIVSKSAGSFLMEYRDIFAQIIPELRAMFDFNQHSKYHCYDVWEHTVKALDHAPNKLDIRLAVLFHDIGKPHCFTIDEKGEGHFYGHGKISKEIAKEVLSKLKTDNKTKETVLTLVENHDVIIEPTKKAVKRRLVKLQKDNFEKLLIVKECDTMGQSEKVRRDKLKYLQEIKRIYNEILDEEQCLSLKELAVSGKDIIRLDVKEGREIGNILNTLFELVVSESLPNEYDTLINKAKEIIGK